MLTLAHVLSGSLRNSLVATVGSKKVHLFSFIVKQNVSLGVAHTTYYFPESRARKVAILSVNWVQDKRSLGKL